jgi:hypothetical protein
MGEDGRGQQLCRGNRSMFGVVWAHVLQMLHVIGQRASTESSNNNPFNSYQIVYQAGRSEAAVMMAVRLAACRISR